MAEDEHISDDSVEDDRQAHDDERRIRSRQSGRIAPQHVEGRREDKTDCQHAHKMACVFRQIHRLTDGLEHVACVPKKGDLKGDENKDCPERHAHSEPHTAQIGPLTDSARA